MEYISIDSKSLLFFLGVHVTLYIFNMFSIFGSDSNMHTHARFMFFKMLLYWFSPANYLIQSQ